MQTQLSIFLEFLAGPAQLEEGVLPHWLLNWGFYFPFESHQLYKHMWKRTGVDLDTPTVGPSSQMIVSLSGDKTAYWMQSWAPTWLHGAAALGHSVYPVKRMPCPPQHSQLDRMWPPDCTGQESKLPLTTAKGRDSYFGSPIWAISLKGGSRLTRVEGCENRCSPQTWIYADSFSLVCAYPVSGRRALKLVMLVEREVGGGWQEQGEVNWWRGGVWEGVTPYFIIANKIFNQLWKSGTISPLTLLTPVQEIQQHHQNTDKARHPVNYMICSPNYLCGRCCPLFRDSELNHTHWPVLYILGVFFQGSCQVRDKVKGTVVFYKEFWSLRAKGTKSHNSGTLFALIITQWNPSIISLNKKIELLKSLPQTNHIWLKSEWEFLYSWIKETL